MAGVSEVYARIAMADALDAKITALDREELQQRGDISEAMEETFEVQAFQAMVNNKTQTETLSLGTLHAAYEREAADNTVEATFARADVRAIQCHTNEVVADQPLDGLPQGKLAHANMLTFQHLADSMDAAMELPCGTNFPEVYKVMAVEDEFEDMLGCIDAHEFQKHIDTAGMMQDSLTMEDRYVTILAQANLCTLQHNTNATEFAPDTIMRNDFPKAYAAIAANDAPEVGLDRADMIDMPARVDEADMESTSLTFSLSENEAVVAALDSLEAVLPHTDMRKLQRRFGEYQSLAAALPGAYSALIEDQQIEAEIAREDIHNLHCCADAAEDLMEPQLWAAGLQKAVDDDAENDKLKTRRLSDCSTCAPDDEEDKFETRQLSSCSTSVPDAFAWQVSAPESLPMAF